MFRQRLDARDHEALCYLVAPGQYQDGNLPTVARQFKSDRWLRGGWMSRFIDKLNQLSQLASQPIGFRATVAVSKPKLLLIAGLAQAKSSGVADYVAGADAGLLQVSKLDSGAEAIKEVLQAVSDIPWGGWLKDVGRDEIAQIVSAGGDFVVFPAASAALATLQDDGVGKILEVEVSLSEGLLRAVDKLPVDAVLIGGEPEEGQFLTWHHLMHFQRCAGLLTKPLLACIPSGVVASELQALCAAGVNGVVVEVGVGQTASRLMELRQMIDELTLPSRPQSGKPAPLVPYLGGRVDTVTEEPEEE